MIRKGLILSFFLLQFLNSIGQKLSLSDLETLCGSTLNNSETLLSKRKFDFIDEKTDSLGKTYNWGFNLQKSGVYADEFISLSFWPDEKNVSFIGYQPTKENWTLLKNQILNLGYIKEKTEENYHGGLTCVYSNDKYKITFSCERIKTVQTYLDAEEFKAGGRMTYEVYIVFKH